MDAEKLRGKTRRRYWLNMEILQELQNRILFCDGGMGSLLQEAGLKPGELPGTWNITHPEELVKIHRAYLEAGADIVTTNTFGVDRLKYNDSTEFQLEPVIRAAVANAKEAIRQSGKQAWIGLDMGPTGKLLKPMGIWPLRTAVPSTGRWWRSARMPARISSSSRP